MGLFDKKALLSNLKGAVADAASKVSESVKNVDVDGAINSVKDKATLVSETIKSVDVDGAISTVKDKASYVTETVKSIDVEGAKKTIKDKAIFVSESVKNVDVDGAINSIKETATSVTEITTETAKIAYATTKETTISTYEIISEEVRSFDYTELGNSEFYLKRYDYYSGLGVQKVTEYFRTALEVDKSTMDMVEDVRSRLPIPAKNIDDIFEQCKREAIRRAIASFALSGVIQDIDNHSSSKYGNLSESYKEFNDRSGFSMTDDPNFSAMKEERYTAIDQWTNLEDGYNKGNPLDPRSADIEHVIAKKELYEDMLLRIGTTDDEFYSLINSSDNLVFAEESFNRSMGATNIHDYLENRGRIDPLDPNIIHVDIVQQDGLVKTVTVNRDDIEEAYNRADEQRKQHRLAAAKEVGMTVVETGAVMAAQQVVGLIVLETIDIFVDEIRDCATNGRIFNADGLLQNTKDMTSRIQDRLSRRFEERQIWSRAKSLGIEAGVAGALSVIPQIIISLIVKLPSFVLALIRECTLSTLRCVRILASDTPNKYESITVILAGAATSIVGIYVGRSISTAISGVPLLNHYNAQVTSVLTGLLVTAIPLTAIYTFEKNKNKLIFITA